MLLVQALVKVILTWRIRWTGTKHNIALAQGIWHRGHGRAPARTAICRPEIAADLSATEDDLCERESHWNPCCVARVRYNRNWMMCSYLYYLMIESRNIQAHWISHQVTATYMVNFSFPTKRFRPPKQHFHPLPARSPELQWVACSSRSISYRLPRPNHGQNGIARRIKIKTPSITADLAETFRTISTPGALNR